MLPLPPLPVDMSDPPERVEVQILQRRVMSQQTVRVGSGWALVLAEACCSIFPTVRLRSESKMSGKIWKTGAAKLVLTRKEKISNLKGWFSADVPVSDWCVCVCVAETHRNCFTKLAT